MLIQPKLRFVEGFPIFSFLFSLFDLHVDG